MFYPVGTYYWSATATNPGTLFGGTWDQVKDRFVLAAGDTYKVGNTGGKATHTLTVAEMPSHSHTTYCANSTVQCRGATASDYITVVRWPGDVGSSAVGGSQPHNNMPPYITAYCWKRTE